MLQDLLGLSHWQPAFAQPVTRLGAGGVRVYENVHTQQGETDWQVAIDQLEAALTQQTSFNGFVDTSLVSSSQIERTLSAGTTSPATNLEDLFNKLRALSANPGNGASLKSAVTSAQAVSSAFNSASASLSQLRGGLDSSITSTVGQINAIAQQIAGLNGQISTLTSQGVSPNSLLDQRGQLVNNLAKLVDVQVQNGNNGQINIIVSGAALVAGTQSVGLTAGGDALGAATVSVAGTDTPLSISGGQLGGFLSQRNQTLADFQARLDSLARQVAVSFNAVQSTGAGSNGGFTELYQTVCVKPSTGLVNRGFRKYQ